MASSKCWLEHQSKHICACGKHPGGYWSDLYSVLAWFVTWHLEKRHFLGKKILFKAIHSWKSWASFIFWKWVIGLLSIESRKLKPLPIEILLEHLCSMMKINRCNGYIFSPLRAKIYWKRQIHKQIIRLSALRICEYSEVKPKGGEDWGVCMGTRVCVHVCCYSSPSLASLSRSHMSRQTKKCLICIWEYHPGMRASLYCDWIRCWLYKYHYLPVLSLTISSMLLRTEASQWWCQGNCWRLPVILEKCHRTLHARWLLMKVMKVHAWKWRPTPYLVLLSFFLFWMHKSTNLALFYSCLTKSLLSFLLLIRSWRDGVKLNLPYSQSLRGPRILSRPQPGLFFFTSSYLWPPEMNVKGTHSGWACQGLKFLWGKLFPSQHLMEVAGGKKCPTGNVF